MNGARPRLLEVSAVLPSMSEAVALQRRLLGDPRVVFVRTSLAREVTGAEYIVNAYYTPRHATILPAGAKLVDAGSVLRQALKDGLLP